MKQIISLFENGRVVACIVLIWLIGSALVFNLGPSKELESWEGGIFFDMQPDYEIEEARGAIDSFGDEGRQLYRKHLWMFDILFIILQTAGIGALFIYATSKFNWSRGWFRQLGWLVVLFAVIDLIENFFISSALTAYPDTTDAQISMMRQVTSIKMMCLPLIGILMVGSILMLLAAAVLHWRLSAGQAGPQT